MPLISIVVGFRNRDVQRVERFLASVENQDFKDFELIFVDYGSDPDVSDSVKPICQQYSWCRYLFNNTRGHFWNRSHALNSGLRFATGEYVLFTDIDLILSRSVLSGLRDHLDPHLIIFHKAYFLPEEFDDYDSLKSSPVQFDASRMSTLGLFQCAYRQELLHIRGFDEYYAIWGPEDRDLAFRFTADRIGRYWMDEKEFPIYHQWHPPSVHNDIIHRSFWWDMMWLHFCAGDKTLTSNNSWGHLFTDSDRKVLYDQPRTSLKIPSKMNAFQRGHLMEDVLFFLKNYSNATIEISIDKNLNRFDFSWERQSKSKSLSNLVNRFNDFCKRLHLPVRIIGMPLINAKIKPSSRPPDEDVMSHLYFMLFQLLKEYRLIDDYCIIETDRQTSFRFFSKAGVDSIAQQHGTSR